MTHRQRLLAVLRGEPVDRPPVVCRLDPWFNARRHSGNELPAHVRGLSLRELQLALGMGVSARNGNILRTRYEAPVTYQKWRDNGGGNVVERWLTPRGELTRISRFLGDDEAIGLSPTIVQYPVRSVDDYVLFEQVVSHLRFDPDYEAFRVYDSSIGADGLPLVRLGATPVHELLLNWTGYETGFIHMLEEPEVFANAVAAADAAYARMWDIIAASPCQLVLHGAHFDSTTTPPPMFRRYFLPYIREFNDRMHAAGKWTVFHADADLSLLLDLMLETGYDVADCLAASPLVPCTLQRARDAWQNRIVMWGGVPSTILEPDVPRRQFEQHLEMMRSVLAPSDRFIGGISDQAMPLAEYERLQAMANALGCGSPRAAPAPASARTVERGTDDALGRLAGDNA